MNYLSTRGGEAVSGMTAVCRGLSKEGGLFVPEKLPEPVDYRDLPGRPFEEVLAVFFHRFLPELSLDIWQRIARNALTSLTEGHEPFQLPLHQLNPYLDRYYLLNADSFPTGSLSDLSAAILKAVWPYALQALGLTGQPLAIGVVTEDYAIAFGHGPDQPKSLLYVPDRGLRGLELSRADSAHLFADSFDAGYRELTALASDPDLDRKLGQAGFLPMFLGPGHLIEVLTSGALAAAVIALAAEEAEDEVKVDFVVSKDHLSFFAGLVYASSLQLPVGLVYVGENDPPSLAPLFQTGHFAFPKKNRRPDDPGALWPVNLERLLFEVADRQADRIFEILRQAEEGNGDWLTEDENHLLNQSVILASSDYKRSVRIIRTIYDQTDYLIGRDTADAVGGWARHSGKHTEDPVCFIQTRSPLFDAYTSGRAILEDKVPKGDYKALVRLLSEEADVPVGQPLRSLLELVEDVDLVPSTVAIRDHFMDFLQAGTGFPGSDDLERQVSDEK